MSRTVLVALVFLGLAGCQQKKDKEPPAAATDRGQPTGDQPAGAAQSAEELGAPLAKVGDVTITVGEFQEQLGRQSPYIRARFTSLEQKREFLDTMIRFEVLAAEAQKRGLDKDPEVVRTMKSMMVQKLMRDEFEKTVPADSVTEDEMKAYYEANKGEYVKPEEIRASAIIVKNKAQAEKIAAEAAAEQNKTNKAFRDLVQKYSTDETTRVRGGDLRYFARDNAELPRAVIDAAFALTATGNVSGAVAAGDGTYWVLKQTGRKKAMTKTYDDVKQSIRTKLHREKRVTAQDQFVGDLRKSAKIETFDDNLAKVRIDTSKKQEAADPHDVAMPPAPGTAEPPGAPAPAEEGPAPAEGGQP